MTKERLAELLFTVWQKERVPGGTSIGLEDAPKGMRKSWEMIAKTAIDVLPKTAALSTSGAAEKTSKVAVIPPGDGWKPAK